VLCETLGTGLVKLTSFEKKADSPHRNAAPSWLLRWSVIERRAKLPDVRRAGRSLAQLGENSPQTI